MATTETQKPKEREPQEQLPTKTLEPVHHKPSLTECFDESANPSTRPSDPVTGVPKRAGEESKERFDEPVNTEALDPPATAEAPVSDIQKRIRRAERFGMPVQLSEEEKRNSRAERFGTGSTMHGSDKSNKSEEQKRKARAERFGLPAQSVADEEAKKKARLLRFAASKMGALQEEKKKARAIRFSQPSSGASSKVNGKTNPEQKTAVVGKAHGGT